MPTFRTARTLHYPPLHGNNSFKIQLQSQKSSRSFYSHHFDLILFTSLLTSLDTFPFEVGKVKNITYKLQSKYVRLIFQMDSNQIVLKSKIILVKLARNGLRYLSHSWVKLEFNPGGLANLFNLVVILAQPQIDPYGSLTELSRSKLTVMFFSRTFVLRKVLG